MTAPVCISVRQPWAWAIIRAGKRIENRAVPDPWRSRVGQRIYIHAAKGCTRDEYEDGADFIEDATGLDATAIRPPLLAALPRGAIVGTAKLTAVAKLGALPSSFSGWFRDDDAPRVLRAVSRSPWSVGPWCLVLDDVRPLSQPLPWKGALGWFPGPPDAEAAIAAWANAGDDL